MQAPEEYNLERAPPTGAAILMSSAAPAERSRAHEKVNAFV